MLKVTSFCPKETTENAAGQRRNREAEVRVGPCRARAPDGHRTRPPKHQNVKTREEASRPRAREQGRMCLLGTERLEISSGREVNKWAEPRKVEAKSPRELTV